MGGFSSRRAISRPTSAEAKNAGQQYLTFHLGVETYAIDVGNVRKIIDQGRLTELPRMPTAIRGVTQLQDSVVPVVDLAARFGGHPSGHPSEAGQRRCVVVAEIAKGEHHMDVGLMVDAVADLIEIPPSTIEPAPEFIGDVHARYVDGMAQIDGAFVLILDIVKCLSIDDLESLANVAQRGTDESAPADGAG